MSTKNPRSDIEEVRRALKHDVGNAIASVSLHVSLAQSAENVPDHIVKHLDGIKQSAADANRLIDELSQRLFQLVANPVADPCQGRQNDVALGRVRDDFFIGQRIMVVDDDAVFLDGLKTLLERERCVVTAFTDPVDAFRKFERSPDAFDLLITDMQMPTLNGAELGKRFHALCHSFPVILASGTDTDFDCIAENDQQNTFRVSKPFFSEELFATIQQALIQRRD